MKQALVLFNCDESTRQRLLQVGEGKCEFHFRSPDWTKEQYHAALKTANIILGEPKKEDLTYCKNLQWMQSTSSGVNYYVESGLFPQDALLSCATGCYGSIISEHLLAMVMALCRRLPEYQEQQKLHKWEIRRYDKPLEDATLMILGAGDIGTTLAKWMRPMVGKIIGVRRSRRAFPACYDEMITVEELDDKLPEADILVCILPHTPETIHLLDETRMRKMKQDAILVNGGRGSLIDQEALIRVMKEGWFWGVGLEVAAPEPLPADHPLWEQPRVLITPHAAGNSFAPGSPLEKKLWKFIIGNLETYLKTGKPGNLVDFSTGYREGIH